MTKKCIISAVVMFVMAWALSFVVHGLLLGAGLCGHAGHAPAGRSAADHLLLILAQAIFGAAFAWVYYQGKEDKPWLTQGSASASRLRASP